MYLRRLMIADNTRGRNPGARFQLLKEDKPAN